MEAQARPLKELPLYNNMAITLNWEFDKDSNLPARTIEDTVLISYAKENEEHKEEDMNDIIDAERTAMFAQPQHCNEKPKLTFIIPEVEHFYISHLYIFCDCKIIEVFGEHDMYLDSIHGTVVEESDDFQACEFRIDLSSKVNKKITIHFLKLLNPAHSRILICGMHLTLKPMSRRDLNSSIRIDNVEELLKDTKISDKASKCFKFLRESMNNPQFSPERMSAASNSSHLVAPNPDKLIVELKQYIDHKFLVLNEFLILRERNLHDKIDLILDYIKSNARN